MYYVATYEVLAAALVLLMCNDSASWLLKLLLLWLLPLFYDNSHLTYVYNPPTLYPKFTLVTLQSYALGLNACITVTFRSMWCSWVSRWGPCGRASELKQGSKRWI